MSRRIEAVTSLTGVTELRRDVTSECRHADAHAAQIRRSAVRQNRPLGSCRSAHASSSPTSSSACVALRAASELATAHAREQPSRAEALENHDDGDGLIAVERAVRRAQCGLGQDALLRVALSSVDHLDARPPAARSGRDVVLVTD